MKHLAKRKNRNPSRHLEIKARSLESEVEVRNLKTLLFLRRVQTKSNLLEPEVEEIVQSGAINRVARQSQRVLGNQVNLKPYYQQSILYLRICKNLSQLEVKGIQKAWTFSVKPLLKPDGLRCPVTLKNEQRKPTLKLNLKLCCRLNTHFQRIFRNLSHLEKRKTRKVCMFSARRRQKQEELRYLVAQRSGRRKPTLRIWHLVKNHVTEWRHQVHYLLWLSLKTVRKSLQAWM